MIAQQLFLVYFFADFSTFQFTTITNLTRRTIDLGMSDGGNGLVWIIRFLLVRLPRQNHHEKLLNCYHYGGQREREREGEKVKGIQFKKKRLHLFSCSFISND